MIATVNNTILIKRLRELSWEKTFSKTVDYIDCYIEPIQDDVWVMIDWQGAFNVFKLYSDFTDIIIGDKLTDKCWVNYKVKWVKLYNSIVGTHIECLIQSVYD
jgi:hypothetical protein